MAELYFTIDVEEWFMAENVKDYFSGVTSHSSLDRIEQFLEYFNFYNTKATFFTVSSLLEQHPTVFSAILSNGHEIASHTVNHPLLTHLSREETMFEVGNSKLELDKLTGKKCVGFRSPSFTSNKFLDEALTSYGYKYTSNGINVPMHDRYSKEFQWSGVDFPIPTFHCLGSSFPVTGGGWFRLWPLRMQTYMINKRSQSVFYLHPWDIDDGQPVKIKDHLKAFRHNVGVKTAHIKLQKLLQTYPCGSTLGSRLKEGP